MSTPKGWQEALERLQEMNKKIEAIAQDARKEEPGEEPPKIDPKDKDPLTWMAEEIVRVTAFIPTHEEKTTFVKGYLKLVITSTIASTRLLDELDEINDDG
jgi:hypothetical protein